MNDFFFVQEIKQKFRQNSNVNELQELWKFLRTIEPYFMGFSLSFGAHKTHKKNNNNKNERALKAEKN